MAEYASLKLVAIITLDKTPEILAVNEETNLVYVGVGEGLVVIDGETNEVLGEIPLEFNAEVLAINSQTNRLFASGSSANATYVIDGDTWSAVGTIPERLYQSYEIAINPVTNLIYIGDFTVALYHYDRVEVYDGNNFTLVTSVNLSSEGHPYIERVGVAVNPATNYIYATWSGNETLYVIDGITNEIVRTKSLYLDFSKTIFVNPFTNYVYVGGEVLDGETLEDLILEYDLYYTGDIRAVNPLHNLVYTTLDERVKVLNGTTHDELGSLNLGWHIWSWDPVAANPKNGKIYIANSGTNEIFVIQGPPFVDDIPPEISVPRQEPLENIAAYQNVTVTVNVTDPDSGVRNVTLRHSIDNGTEWTSMNMTEISTNTYQAVIPGYENCTWVTYEIIAYDNQGNQAINNELGYYYSYHVIVEFSSTLQLLMTLTLLTLALAKMKNYSR